MNICNWQQPNGQSLIKLPWHAHQKLHNHCSSQPKHC